MTPPLSTKQLKALDKLVIEEKNFVGRDALWRLISEKKTDLKISRRQIMNYIKGSETHQLYKAKRKTKHIQPTILKSPNLQIWIDLINMTSFADGEYKWIFSAIDMFSRKSYVEPMKNKNVKDVINALTKILEKIGDTPHSLRSDNDSAFTAIPFKSFVKEKNIRHQFSSADTPASNGMIERFNGKIKRQIRMIRTAEDDIHWAKYLQKINDNLNNTYHRIIKMTPNQ